MAAGAAEKARAVKIEVRVLVTEEDGVFNATCLEMGLATAGPDRDAVLHDMVDVIVAHLQACAEEGRPQDAFVPAPAEFWQAYAEAVRSGACRTKKLNVPSVSKRTAADDYLSDLVVRSFVCAAH